VALAMAARARLLDEGIAVRVVSMPATSVFDRQDAAWREQVLAPGIPRLAVEAAHPDGWWKYLAGAPRAEVVGINRFGASAPAEAVAESLGMTAEAVVAAARRLIG